MLHTHEETICHTALIHKYEGKDRKVIKLRLNTMFIIYNISKVYTEDIYEKINDLNEYNSISDGLVNVIIKSLGRAILIYGIQDNVVDIVNNTCSSLDNYIVDKALTSYINPSIFESDDKTLHTIVELVVNDFKNDFNKITGSDMNNVEDVFSMFSEEYITTDYGMFKFSDGNIISILEL